MPCLEAERPVVWGSPARTPRRSEGPGISPLVLFVAKHGDSSRPCEWLLGYWRSLFVQVRTTCRFCMQKCTPTHALDGFTNWCTFKSQHQSCFVQLVYLLVEPQISSKYLNHLSKLLQGFKVSDLSSTLYIHIGTLAGPSMLHLRLG